MKRDFTIGIAWSAASSLVEQGANVLVFLLIARLIGTEAFGVASMAFAFLFFGEYLVRDTVTEAIVERRELEHGRLEATFATLVGFALVIVGALCAIAQIAAAIYDRAEVAPLLTVASPTVLMIAAAGVSTALLRRRMAYRALAIRTMAGVIAGGIVGIVMAAADFGAWSLVGQRLVQAGINSVFAITAAGWVPRRLPRWSEFALLRGLAPRVVVLRSLTLFILQTPTVALGIFAEPAAVGLFAFAQRLLEIVVGLMVRPLTGVAQSALAELRRRDGSTAQFFLELSEFTALFNFAAFAGLALVAAPAIQVLVGPEWSGSAQILPVLCISGVAFALSSVEEAYLLAIDRLDGFLRASLVEAVLGAVLVGTAAAFGPMAATAAVSLRAVVGLALRSRAALLPERIGAPAFLAALSGPVLLAAGMATAVSGWRAVALGRIDDTAFLVSAIAIGCAAFAGLLFGFMRRTFGRLRSFVAAAQ